MPTTSFPTVLLAAAAIAATSASARASDEPSSSARPAAVPAAAAAQEALPEGQVRVLRAVIMSTGGRVQWSANGKPPWTSARVDQILKPGTTIRTGLRSSIALRVGKNSTLLIDGSTRVRLPEFVQDGATLRTVVGLDRGRVDFKVDRIGLTNDFTVVTPSTTLAVRGTIGAIRHGSLEGTQAVGARSNRIRAIELRYFNEKVQAYLSGLAGSSEQFMDPVVHALYQTIGPPVIMSGAILDDRQPPAIAGSFTRDQALENLRTVEYGIQNTMRTAMETGAGRVGPDGQPLWPGGTDVPPGNYNVPGGTYDVPPGSTGGSGNTPPDGSGAGGTVPP